MSSIINMSVEDTVSNSFWDGALVLGACIMPIAYYLLEIQKHTMDWYFYSYTNYGSFRWINNCHFLFKRELRCITSMKMDYNKE